MGACVGRRRRRDVLAVRCFTAYQRREKEEERRLTRPGKKAEPFSASSSSIFFLMKSFAVAFFVKFDAKADMADVSWSSPEMNYFVAAGRWVSWRTFSDRHPIPSLIMLNSHEEERE